MAARAQPKAAAATRQQASAADFRSIAESLMPELIEDLDKEHQREVTELYQEELDLREELKRIVTLMQTEILPREKMMHDMIEKMHLAAEAATKQLHEKMAEHMGKGLGDHNQKRQELLDPLAEMEDELHRIATLLSHDVVAPDIAGWKAPGSAAARPAAKAAAGARAPLYTPAARQAPPSPRGGAPASPRGGPLSPSKPSPAAGQRSPTGRGQVV